MSHAHIWDDTALIDSWNGALDEYKHYHSIHARGEKVEDAIKSHLEKDGQKETLQERDVSETASTKPPADPELVDDDVMFETTSARNELTIPAASTEQNTDVNPNSSPAESPQIPQHLVGAVHDEGLKNLLMSWYYAGYYTGLYEGQQIASDAKAGS